MANTQKLKGVIAILTGGGDVPGLNPAIRAITIRANREGYQVIGLRRGWAGITELVRDKKADNSKCFMILTNDIVNKAGRTGGTFLHSSRTRPSHLPKASVPEHLKDTYTEEFNDLTPEVIKNLEWLGIDIPENIQGGLPPKIGHPILSEVYPLSFLSKEGDWRAIFEGDFKFIWNSKGRHQLFHLTDDPRERINLAQKEPQMVNRLMAKMNRYLDSLPEPGPAPQTQELDENTKNALKSLGYVNHPNIDQD